MDKLFIMVVVGMVLLKVGVILWGAGAAGWLLEKTERLFLGNRARLENTRDLVYFLGGMASLAPGILGFEGQRTITAAFVVVTALVVALVGLALTRRIEQL